ncbi:HNH endonuclease [Pseudomonas sp. F8002]|uniref:HNH endonuclease n=1 Tax=Pseudomonas sp. F8002 TaxID=2738822 RepID=UPI0015A03072|nr:HNH endonuclease [Pseudomonas sp. F8002]NWB56502.1 HNH endonuclease [Pseudomonas sp. F8002]
MQISEDTLYSNRVQLEKTYAIKEAHESRAEDWGPQLWAFVKAQVPFSVSFESLREPGFQEVLHDRFVNYVFSRLILGAVHAANLIDTAELDEEESYESLSASVETILDVEPDIRDRIVWYLDRIAWRIKKKEADPTRGQKNSIKKLAIENRHRCYLCGKALHYNDSPFGSDDDAFIKEKRQKRAFEIEHIWSQARGGGRGRDNLAASCSVCNKLKKHLVNFTDIAVEQIMTTAVEPESVRYSMSAEFRFALIWRQQGKCFFCSRKFHDVDTEDLLLVKRERTQPYHFFNMMLVCLDCNKNHFRDGVNLSA